MKCRVVSPSVVSCSGVQCGVACALPLIVVPVCSRRRTSSHCTIPSLHSHLNCTTPSLHPHPPQLPCMGRETLYAAGYLGLCPILYDKLQGHAAFKARSMRHCSALRLTSVSCWAPAPPGCLILLPVSTTLFRSSNTHRPLHIHIHTCTGFSGGSDGRRRRSRRRVCSVSVAPL